MDEGNRDLQRRARRLALGGATLWLLAERAVWWPDRRTLFVSDLHLGRPAGDRPGSEAAREAAKRDLARLDSLSSATEAESVVVLGDLRHAPAPHLGAADAVLRAWSRAKPDPALLLIRGNQDERTGDPPRDWGIETVDQGHRIGCLTLFHHPPEAHQVAGLETDTGPAAWMAGHLHPGTGQRDETDRGRRTAPAFLLEGSGLVLPAFGEGTHAHPPRPRPHQRRLAIEGGRVLAPR
ncbi:MAG: hypothetical protein AAFZ65_08595 [Planctomycetota bacterium]